jgi:hypothetical protein
LEKELKALSPEHYSDHNLVFELEERLLHHENKLAKELARIESHNENNGQYDRHQLEERALVLIQRAKDELERIHREGRGHLVQEIEYEIGLIEDFVEELRVHPSSHFEAEHGRQIEQRLAEHERRLAEALKRIKE